MKYVVTLNRAIFQSTEMEVEADSEDAACEKAEKLAQRSVDGDEGKDIPLIEWELTSDAVEVEECVENSLEEI